MAEMKKCRPSAGALLSLVSPSLITDNGSNGFCRADGAAVNQKVLPQCAAAGIFGGKTDPNHTTVRPRGTPRGYIPGPPAIWKGSAQIIKAATTLKEKNTVFLFELKNKAAAAAAAKSAKPVVEWLPVKLEDIEDLEHLYCVVAWLLVIMGYTSEVVLGAIPDAMEEEEDADADGLDFLKMYDNCVRAFDIAVLHVKGVQAEKRCETAKAKQRAAAVAVQSARISKMGNVNVKKRRLNTVVDADDDGSSDDDKDGGAGGAGGDSDSDDDDDDGAGAGAAGVGAGDSDDDDDVDIHADTAGGRAGGDDSNDDSDSDSDDSDSDGIAAMLSSRSKAKAKASKKKTKKASASSSAPGDAFLKMGKSTLVKTVVSMYKNVATMKRKYKAVRQLLAITQEKLASVNRARKVERALAAYTVKQKKLHESLRPDLQTDVRGEEDDFDDDGDDDENDDM